MSEQTEFKFPDELPKEEPKADDLEIEIVDDTPEADRNRAPMPKEVVQELENDDLEEYSDKVKKRLSQMKKVWHDERREKERVAREREEALQFAQKAYEENKQLKQRLGNGEQAYAKVYTESATRDLALAKDKLKQAYDSGDSEQIANAQTELNDAQFKLREAQRYKPALQTKENDVQTSQQASAPNTAAAPVDPKAEAWRKDNRWFGQNKGMTAFALGLHEELVESGVDPRSDKYYEQLNQTMRKRFPESFEEPAEQTTDREEKPTRTQRAANVVAPATRSTAPRRITLTQSQVALAKKFGLSNEQYAREVMKIEGV